MMNRRAGRDRGRDYRNSNNYNDHDDRVGGPHDGARRVQFKHPVGKDRRNKRQTGWDTKHIRSLILSNDDIDMSSTVTDRRLGGDRQNKGRQQQPMDRRGGGRGKKNLKYMATGYYRVDIRGGGRFTRDYLLKIIASHLKPTPLLPLQVKVVNNDFQFTLEDYDTAVKVMNAHHQITLSNGWRINIHVRPFTPTIELDEKLTAVMKNALASRYQIATKALDLSHFQMDPAFISEEIICPLNRPDVMSYVLELISDYVPDLVALNLDRNNIAAVDHLKVMIDKFPNLRILHMANNLIRDVKQLDSLKGLKLEEVNLDGNSLASSFNDKDTYIREIRQRFPKVIKLDGIDLPKPITFDLEDVEETHVPKSQMTFMCDPGPGAEMARKFIEQYFQVFDSIDRSLLLAAYHDNAHFSMQCCLAPSEVHSMFSGYMPENRNLLRATTLERRLKLLKIGKQSIIETLKDFPATAHELMSFVVDLVYFTPELIQLVVGGLYKELKKVNNTGTGIKYFNRVFLIVPVGGGFCIVNEELTIMYPTAAQIKSINSKPKDLVVVPPVPSVAGSPSVAGIDGGSNEMALKRQMITEMAAKSGMNLGWSEKCLAETNWNFDQAVFAFTQLRDSNQIPPEAFLP